MQTYKAFLKIALKNYPSMLVYLIIFVMMALIASVQVKQTTEEIYKDTEINFTVFNRDDSRIGEALQDYLSEKNIFVELEDDEEVIRGALYYREIYYALIIPEGFEAAIASGKDMELMNYKVTDSSVGYYMDMYVENYMRVLKSYLAAGCELEEAITKTADTLTDSVEASLTEDDKGEITEAEKPQHYYFYQYAAYIFMGVIISGMGPILIIFGKKDVKMRIAVSAQTFKNYGLQMLLGVVTFGMAVFGLVNVLSLIMYGSGISLAEYVCFLVLTLCFVMVCLGLSFMGGFLFRKTEVMGAFTNVVALGFSFLGGIFVPFEMLGGTIKNIARFTPTYWYMQANNVIVGIEKFSDLNVGEFAKECGILILYALAFACIGLAVLRHRREEA